MLLPVMLHLTSANRSKGRCDGSCEQQKEGSTGIILHKSNWIALT